MMKTKGFGEELLLWISKSREGKGSRRRKKKADIWKK